MWVADPADGADLSWIPAEYWLKQHCANMEGGRNGDKQCRIDGCRKGEAKLSTRLTAAATAPGELPLSRVDIRPARMLNVRLFPGDSEIELFVRWVIGKTEDPLS